MGYSGSSGRKPFERASKISHAEIIRSPKVADYLADCEVPSGAPPLAVTSHVQSVAAATDSRLTTVVAVDGGYTEVSVRDDFPSATIAFFTFGPLLFSLADLKSLDQETFIAPEDLAKLKRIERHTVVFPTRNISRRGKALRLTVRETLHEFFTAPRGGDPPLLDAFRWLIFRGWEPGPGLTWELPTCPNPGCARERIPLTRASPGADVCSDCGGPIYVIDALRLHERVDEEQGAGGILGYVMTTLEQMVIVHAVKALWESRRDVLREVIFIKDGPLAFFGQTAPLSRPMRELASFLLDQPDPTGPSGARASFFNVVGLEKSGAFVEHAMQVEAEIEPGCALVFDNDYIYRYVIPGDPSSADPYGQNTYWGSKMIYKALDGNVYVMTVPTGAFNAAPSLDDFPNISEICGVVGSLRCSMYDNALIPIALVNKLVSLSDFPSARILETFARAHVS